MTIAGITNATNQDELRGIANAPESEFVFNADNFDALQAIEERVVTAACQAASGLKKIPKTITLALYF